jgi:spore coat protein U-like protein
MMKTKLIVAGLASMLTLVPAAQAATVAGSFNVTVSLTSFCSMAVIGDLAFGTYVAYQVGAQTATPTTATLTCTRGMLLSGITAAFDTGATGSTAAAAAANAVGAGVLAGLQYDITATPGTVTAGAAATASSIGGSDSRPYTISGTMLAAQPGNATVGAVSQSRTLTITY